MKRKHVLATIMIMSMMIGTIDARVHASSITEVEGNDSIAGAQNIDGSFTTGANVNIANPNTIPWVSVANSTTEGGGTTDYFSFTVQNDGDMGIFDIDFGYEPGGPEYFDSFIVLWGPGGDIAHQDDSSPLDGASGSGSWYDSFLEHTFPNAGLYTLGVADFGEGGGGVTYDEFGFTKGGITLGYTYTLQISLPAAEPIPEPATVALLGIGLAGLAGAEVRRRRKKKAVGKR